VAPHGQSCSRPYACSWPTASFGLSLERARGDRAISSVATVYQIQKVPEPVIRPLGSPTRDPSGCAKQFSRSRATAGGGSVQGGISAMQKQQSNIERRSISSPTKPVLNSDATSERPMFPSSKYSRAVEDTKKVVGKSVHMRTFRGTK